MIATPRPATSFMTDLRYSQGYTRQSAGQSVESVIAAMIAGVIDVQPTAERMDRAGVDYVATLRRGAEVFVDLKVRRPGCSRYWHDGTPEIALESWSVVPDDDRGKPGKVGWALDEAKITHYVLAMFAPEDSRACYMLPFQLLRTAFRRRFNVWMHGPFRVERQATGGAGGGWKSECVFVPAPVVLNAISDVAVLDPRASAFAQKAMVLP